MSSKAPVDLDDDYTKNDYIGILVKKTDSRKKSEDKANREVGYYKFSKPQNDEILASETTEVVEPNI